MLECKFMVLTETAMDLPKLARMRINYHVLLGGILRAAMRYSRSIPPTSSYGCSLDPKLACHETEVDPRDLQFHTRTMKKL